MGGASTVRVLLGVEQSLFREALRTVLESREDIEVVAEVGDGPRAIAEAERARPTVAFLTVNLPGCDGLISAGRIKEVAPECGVVVLDSGGSVRVLVRALEAGATGYLSGESPLVDFIEAARAIHRGETLVPKQMLGALLGRLIRRRRDQDDHADRTARLTRRERQILVLLAGGADNHSIARDLVISPETARTHIQRVLNKLGVHSRLEAAAFVVRHGLLEELADATA